MKTKAKSVKYCIVRFSPNSTAFRSKIREGPYYICSICNRILYKKTVIQLKKKTNVQHSARTIYRVVYPWFLSVLEWPITYRLMTTFYEIDVCPWPDLSSLFQYTSPTPVVSLQLISRIQYHLGIPVTLLTGSSFTCVVTAILRAGNPCITVLNAIFT